MIRKEARSRELGGSTWSQGRARDEEGAEKGCPADGGGQRRRGQHRDPRSSSSRAYEEGEAAPNSPEERRKQEQVGGRRGAALRPTGRQQELCLTGCSRQDAGVPQGTSPAHRGEAWGQYRARNSALLTNLTGHPVSLAPRACHSFFPRLPCPLSSPTPGHPHPFSVPAHPPHGPKPGKPAPWSARAGGASTNSACQS